MVETKLGNTEDTEIAEEYFMSALDEVAEKVIGATIEVHREKGPGLLESTYEACLAHEMRLRELSFSRQVPVPRLVDGVTRIVNDRIAPRTLSPLC